MSYDFRVVSLNLRTKHLYTSMCIILIVIRKNLSKFKSAYFFQSLSSTSLVCLTLTPFAISFIYALNFNG